MPTEVLMPALSPTMEKGNLAKWLKKEGDQIRSGDVIAEIETDKATMEVEATDDGTLRQTLVTEGNADVDRHTPIAVILGEGEDKFATKNKPAQQQMATAFASQAKAKADANVPVPRIIQRPARETEGAADPDIPEGTDMLTVTMREGLGGEMRAERRA